MRGRRGNSGWVVKQIKYIFRKKEKKELTLESEVTSRKKYFPKTTGQVNI